MKKVLKVFSKLVLTASAGAVSGASRMGDYQPKESEVLKKIKEILIEGKLSLIIYLFFSTI